VGVAAAAPVARGEAEFGAVEERVRPAVERELGARRLRKVERERPDFLVTYYAAIEKPIDAKAITYAAGVPLMTRPVTSYERGSFVLDVLDARTGKLLWRGVGVASSIRNRPPSSAANASTPRSPR